MDPNDQFTEEPLNSVDSVDSVGGGEPAWEPPVPLGAFNPPPFPTGALPEWLRDQVQAVAISTQTPPDLSAILGTCVCASAVAKKAIVRVREDFEEPLNAYGVIVLPSGERKSRVFSIMTDPIEKYEEELVQESGPRIAEAVTAYKIKEQELAHIEKQAAKAKGPARSNMESRAKELARELAEMSVPGSPQLLADDVTPEKLAILLAEQGGRMAVMSAEGGIFDIISGRYSANNAPNLDVFLKGHSGDTLKVDRVGRKKQFVKGPALTMALTVQPDVIQGLMTKPTLRGRGLLARFMYSFPRSIMGHREVNPPVVPRSVTDAYKVSVRKLLELPFETDGEGNPPALTLERGAADALWDFAREIEPQLGELGNLAALTDWAGKLVGLVVRLAGILHMATLVDEHQPWAIPISAETMAHAIEIGRYLTDHAKGALMKMGANKAVEDARMILDWGKSRRFERFSRRDLWQDLRHRFEAVDDLEVPLNLLIEHSFLRREALPKPSGPGRKPSPTFVFNPTLGAQNTHNTQNPPQGGNSVDSVQDPGPPKSQPSTPSVNGGGLSPEDHRG